MTAQGRLEMTLPEQLFLYVECLPHQATQLTYEYFFRITRLVAIQRVVRIQIAGEIYVR